MTFAPALRWPAPGVTGRLPQLRLAEQRHDRLRRLVGDRQRLDTELLLDLEGLQLGAFLGEVGVDQITDRGLDDVAELAGTQQLVQYSQVEQSIQQTGVLRNMLDRMSSDDLTSAGQLIGKTAEFDSSIAGLTASKIIGRRGCAGWGAGRPGQASTMIAAANTARPIINAA